MKLKRLISAIVALALVLSMSVSAFAADWYLEDGDITVSANENGQSVQQGAITPRTARLLFHSGIAPRQRAAPSP